MRAKNTSFVIFSVLIGFLLSWSAVEIALTMYFNIVKKQSRYEYLHGWLPYNLKNQMHLGSKINAEGYGVDIISHAKADNVFRIVMLGGSSLFLKDLGGKIKNQLESSGHFTKIELANLAFPAHTTKDSLLKMQYQFRHSDADLVIIYHAINDIMLTNFADEVFKDDYSHGRHYYKRNIFMDRSLLFTRIRLPFIIKSSRKNFSYGFGDKLRTKKAFRNNIEQILEINRKNGSSTYLINFAYYIPEDYSLEKFKKRKLDYSPEIGDINRSDDQSIENWGLLPVVKEGLEAHRAIVKNIAEKYGTIYSDMNNDIPHTGIFFSDVCHFTYKGGDVFAQKAVEHIVKNLSPSTAFRK